MSKQRYMYSGAMKMPMVTRTGNVHLPETLVTGEHVNAMLREGLVHDPSDFFIVVGHPIVIELDRLHRMTNRSLDSTEFELIAKQLRSKESGATSCLSQGEDWDGAYTLMDYQGRKRRLRISMTALSSLNNNNSMRFTLRPLDDEPPSPETIGLRPELLKILFPKEGAVFVCGPTGSGKTTTFASMVRYAAEGNTRYHGHLATYEQPPEYDLESLTSEHMLITQVGIGQPWGLPTFGQGIRNAMRNKPCAILIGEVRDLETVQAVTEAALTGHPCFGTVHADRPAVAFQRLISRYPASLRSQGLYDLITTTKVIVAQRLVPGIHRRKVAIREHLEITPELMQRLLDQPDERGVVALLNNCISEYGRTFAEDAAESYERGEISIDTLRSVVG